MLTQTTFPTFFLQFSNLNTDRSNFCFSYVFFLELTSQLLAAENKCNILEKQLEYMRTMIKHAEMERTSVLEKQV